MTRKAQNYDCYQTFEDLVKNIKIPEKKWKFFQCLIDEKAQTFGNATKSYIAAGYSETTTCQYRARDLYNSALMQRLVYLWHKKTSEKRENRNISIFDKTDNDLLWALEEAKNKNDYANVRAIAMDRAKLHGLLIDRHQVIDPDTEQRIDKTMKIEAARIAESRLLESGKSEGKAEQNIIETDFIEPEKIDCPTDLSNDPIESAILSENN